MERFQFDSNEFRLIEESCIPYAVYQFLDKRVVTVALSAGFCEVFGFSDKKDAYALMDQNMYRDTHPEDMARIADAAHCFATEGGQYSVIYRTLIDGEYHIVHALGKHIYKDGNVRLAVIWYTDEGVYDEKNEAIFNRALEKELVRYGDKFKNAYDQRTGLPGMNYFFELAQEGWKQLVSIGESPALVYFDLNGMKNFNARYGYAEGDKVLLNLAGLLTDHFSNENCCRIGGDHFAVFTKESGLEENLKQIFSEFERANIGKNIPVRAGIYLHRMGEAGIGVACDRAKMACDINRDSVESKYTYFNEEMLEETERRHYIIERLDKALEEGFVQVYYQPIVRTVNGCVCDEEALARWIDPVKGFLSPGDFIPILEEAGLIYKLDLYMTEQILKKMKRQEEAGLYLVPCSVNISRSDFESCDIVEEIKNRVDAAGIDREKITIEITESVIGSDISYMKKQVERFHELGFKVWMDDYGSGYSSPDILQEIPFDTIKLDMQFMRHFDHGEKSKIIISELIRMATGLGIETVAEGVETKEQADFLKDVGCTKLQGFHFCKPIPMEKILERYETGTQIGFENPLEAGYFSAIGSTNLFDMTVTDSEEHFGDYFNTMPMAVLEIGKEKMSVIRSNQSYREFIRNNFDLTKVDVEERLDTMKSGRGAAFAKAIMQCAEDGKQVVTDERTKDGKRVHLFMRRIAVNPVTKVKALAVVVLGVADETMMGAGLTYAHVAQALSADYIDLYYVNLENNRYIEYRPDAGESDMVIARRGNDFFNSSRQEACKAIYEEDRESFLQSFEKEHILRSIDEHGAYTCTYRLLMGDDPVYVNMKAIYIGTGKRHIIIGVNNVDVQMKGQEALEHLKEERATYSRIMALSGDYICFYTVDPETDHYIEFSATADYESLGVAKEGDHFFDSSKREGQRTIFFEDRDLFLNHFTKENIFDKIHKNGLFVMNYRLVINEEPRYVCLKAALVTEEGKQQLIIGLSDIDAQVKRDQEYAYNLSAARNRANLDELTGVKNKHAYIDVEKELNKMIDEHNVPPFAIVVLDLNGLKNVNDTLGHQAGDEFLKKGCAMICEIFRNSPVFRVGGDEFVVFVRGNDYDRIDLLMEKLQEKNREHQASGDVVVAGGMARFENDVSVEIMFKRADDLMYKNKAELKKI